MTDEFDDVKREGTGGIFVSSEKARAEMSRLASDHGLYYTHNPGGGEFGISSNPAWRCQISTMDDLKDLAKLREALHIPHPNEKLDVTVIYSATLPPESPSKPEQK